MDANVRNEIKQKFWELLSENWTTGDYEVRSSKRKRLLELFEEKYQNKYCDFKLIGSRRVREVFECLYQVLDGLPIRPAEDRYQMDYDSWRENVRKNYKDCLDDYKDALTLVDEEDRFFVSIQHFLRHYPTDEYHPNTLKKTLHSICYSEYVETYGD